MTIRDVLETVLWGMDNFGSLFTNRQLPRRDMMRAVKKGLVRSVGMVEPCDGDGAIISGGRQREGFVLTATGIEALGGKPANAQPDHAV